MPIAGTCRNERENPTGIETAMAEGAIYPNYQVATSEKTRQGLKQISTARSISLDGRRNERENPTGIETGISI
jgi:hypothetical protein